MKYHKTKDGRKILIKNMSDDHLLNTMHLIKRLSKEGIKTRQGGGFDAEDIWYEEDILYGKRAKVLMNYKSYKKEAKQRNLI